MLSRLTLERRLLQGALQLPALALRPLKGRSVRLDGQRLDDRAQILIRLLAQNQIAPQNLDPYTARKRYRRMIEVMDPLAPQCERVMHRDIPRPDGSLMNARLYTPYGPKRPPLIVFFHGGGFVIGSLGTHDAFCRSLAVASDAAVLSVDYRLSPENAFPAAFDDAMTAFDWACDHASALGVDPTRIGVCGDSAGATLAFHVVYQRRGAALPSRYLLFYPATDFTGCGLDGEPHPSRALFSDGFLLTGGLLDWFKAQAFPRADLRDPRISPLLIEDLKGCAPGRIITAGFDPLRDEGEAMVARLRAAGCSTCHRRHGDLYHSFIDATRLIPRAHEAVTESGHWMRSALLAGL
ncbi:alpha/beta hydrolase [Myxococcota bacterium]|nr:alpha/beta hydrolase [Myxococcota bacterium]